VNEEIELYSESVKVIEQSKPLAIIQTPAEFISANEFLQLNKRQQKKIEEYFNPEIESANKTHKGLCAKKKALLEPLQANYTEVSLAAGKYQLEQERKIEIEKKRLEAEAEAAAEATRQAIIAEADRQEEKGDYEFAAAVLDQVQDVEVATVKAPVAISGVKTTVGATGWEQTKEISIDFSKLNEILQAIIEGKLTQDCIEIKIGPLKRNFKNTPDGEYFGITVTTISKPRTRAY
jgi:hypothetical protein